MTWFVNYTLDSSISVADRGLAYGDGVFETISVNYSCFYRLEDHLARLQRGLRKLGMPFTGEQKESLESFLKVTVLPTINDKSVVKIIVSRGTGGRGYLPPKNASHTIVIGILPAPNYQLEQDKGVSLSLSPISVNTNRHLAGIKHLNRLENVMAKQFLSETDFESILLNNHGNIIECIQSNIFWFKKGMLLTPSLESSGVQGTYRKAIMENQSIYSIQCGVYSLSDIESAEEVFIANSLLGVVPVTKIVDQHFPIGIHTRKLQSLMQAKDTHALY